MFCKSLDNSAKIDPNDGFCADTKYCDDGNTQVYSMNVRRRGKEICAAQQQLHFAMRVVQHVTFSSTWRTTRVRMDKRTNFKLKN